MSARRTARRAQIMDHHGELAAGTNVIDAYAPVSERWMLVTLDGRGKAWYWTCADIAEAALMVCAPAEGDTVVGLYDLDSDAFLLPGEIANRIH